MWLILLFFHWENTLFREQTKSQCGVTTMLMYVGYIVAEISSAEKATRREEKSTKFSIEKVKMINENIRNFSCGRYKFAQHITTNKFFPFSFALLLDCCCCCCCYCCAVSDVSFAITCIYLFVILCVRNFLSWFGIILSLGFCWMLCFFD